MRNPTASPDAAPSDAERWDARYRAGHHDSGGVHPWLIAQADALPARGRALDIAGGSGANAVWLAQRGLDVTLSDVSEVALQLAQQRADEATVRLHRVCVDLTQPARLEIELGLGWDLITCTNYFQPSLFTYLATALAVGGVFVFAQPTLTNLQRHPRPSARFLFDPKTQRQLFDAFELIELFEGWTADGARAGANEQSTHELRVVARKRG